MSVEPVRTDKGMWSEDEMALRIAALVARERERTGRGNVTVRYIEPRQVQRKDARKRPNKSYLKGNKVNEAPEDRAARELRLLRVRIEEARAAA